jgi:hypothetical protein
MSCLLKVEEHSFATLRLHLENSATTHRTNGAIVEAAPKVVPKFQKQRPEDYLSHWAVKPDNLPRAARPYSVVGSRNDQPRTPSA